MDSVQVGTGRNSVVLPYGEAQVIKVTSTHGTAAERIVHEQRVFQALGGLLAEGTKLVPQLLAHGCVFGVRSSCWPPAVGWPSRRPACSVHNLPRCRQHYDQI